MGVSEDGEIMGSRIQKSDIFSRKRFFPGSISRDVGRSGEVPGVVGEVWGSEIMRCLMEIHETYFKIDESSEK